MPEAQRASHIPIHRLKLAIFAGRKHRDSMVYSISKSFCIERTGSGHHD